MRKLPFLLMILVVSACHKEFGANAGNKDEVLVMNAIKQSVPAAEVKKLEWELMEPIEHYGTVLGYKVPFENNTDSTYSFILANLSNHTVGTLYKNFVAYKDVNGGWYPSFIRNYNYATKVAKEYDTKNLIKESTLNADETSTSSKVEEELTFPAVTLCAEHNTQPGEEKTFKYFDTYILSYLMGGAEMANNGTKAQKKPALAYYDPQPLKNSLQKDKKSIIAWDLNR